VGESEHGRISENCCDGVSHEYYVEEKEAVKVEVDIDYPISDDKRQWMTMSDDEESTRERYPPLDALL
jgi:hypothetical protein